MSSHLGGLNDRPRGRSLLSLGRNDDDDASDAELEFEALAFSSIQRQPYSQRASTLPLSKPQTPPSIMAVVSQESDEAKHLIPRPLSQRSSAERNVRSQSAILREQAGAEDEDEVSMSIEHLDEILEPPRRPGRRSRNSSSRDAIEEETPSGRNKRQRIDRAGRTPGAVIPPRLSSAKPSLTAVSSSPIFAKPPVRRRESGTVPSSSPLVSIPVSAQAPVREKTNGTNDSVASDSTRSTGAYLATIDPVFGRHIAAAAARLPIVVTTIESQNTDLDLKIDAQTRHLAKLFSDAEAETVEELRDRLSITSAEQAAAQTELEAQEQNVASLRGIRDRLVGEYHGLTDKTRKELAGSMELALVQATDDCKAADAALRACQARVEKLDRSKAEILQAQEKLEDEHARRTESQAVYDALRVCTARGLFNMGGVA
ncbi:hypothetical protein VDGE_08274 [Verticillium dahliae]|uniref:Uncharacterized protein n=1 Tax=Verticillium dahliae TaxID=27337 RepID=A0A444S130_VERDA|nr:hypothetical protein VDGE_08274 [Verticillium dahliae]